MMWCTRTFLLAGVAAIGMTWAAPADAGAPVVIYTFTGGADGGAPAGGLVVDKAGNLYGVVDSGGEFRSGAVFKLTPPATPSGTWSESVLYSFTGGGDGEEPVGLSIASSGVLYGATWLGGNSSGDGTVFELIPPSSEPGPWTFHTIFQFRSTNGSQPLAAPTIDSAGNILGTTNKGGVRSGCCGVVYKLSPPASGSGFWTETVLHAFTGGSDGAYPQGPVTLDSSGNIYGTATSGGLRKGCCGVVFELSPAGSPGTWSETELHAFSGPDGIGPVGNVAFDANGNLYGVTSNGSGRGTICYQGCGAAFRLTPPSSPSAPWTDTTLYRFAGGAAGSNPNSVLYLNGQLYGTTFGGGVISDGEFPSGVIFALAPFAPPRKYWAETMAVPFTDYVAGPMALVTDPPVSGSGRFYGVAERGPNLAGVVFSWSP